MSEWDYLPTPYETMVKNEETHSLLLLLSLSCIVEGGVIHPFDIFQIVKKYELIQYLVKDEVDKIGLMEFIRNLLQYEDVRSEKKREKIIIMIREYVKRNGTKNI